MANALDHGAACEVPLRAYEAVIAALTQAQLAAPLADDIARDAFARAGRDGVCRSLARARASSSEVATKLALRPLAPPWRSALRLAARAVDAGADVRQAAAFARRAPRTTTARSARSTRSAATPSPPRPSRTRPRP